MKPALATSARGPGNTALGASMMLHAGIAALLLHTEAPAPGPTGGMLVVELVSLSAALESAAPGSPSDAPAPPQAQAPELPPAPDAAEPEPPAAAAWPEPPLPAPVAFDPPPPLPTAVALPPPPPPLPRPAVSSPPQPRLPPRTVPTRQTKAAPGDAGSAPAAPAAPAAPPAAEAGSAGAAGAPAAAAMIAAAPAGPPLILDPRFREPPLPPRYPKRARELDQQGEVLVRALIDERGAPGEIRIWRSSGYPLLDRAAELAVRSWAFEPALSDNRPVAAWVQVPVRFRIH